MVSAPLPSSWDSLLRLEEAVFSLPVLRNTVGRGRRHSGNPSLCCRGGQCHHSGSSAASADGLCKEGRENPTWCEDAGFAVLILTRRCIIIGGICTNISRFCLSLLESVSSAVNQSLANLQKTLNSSRVFFHPPLSAGNAAQVTNVL